MHAPKKLTQNNKDITLLNKIFALDREQNERTIQEHTRQMNTTLT